MWMVGVILTLSIAFCKAQTGPIVTTNYGELQGLHETLDDGRGYDVFKGVPFAQPPIGEKRYLKADPLTPWQGVLPATAFSANCPQFIAPVYPIIDVNGETSEDCLYLNVYVPGGVADVSSPLPVMFYIFGGAFVLGAADMYPGQELAVNGDVIVVTFNYRVGTFGFLANGNDNAPGNQGLWDSAAALAWVHENIANFGGDADRITVFGQSAGAASASHLLLSPHTRGLFKRMIAISGSSTAYFGTTERYQESTRAFASLNGCLFNIINCLRGKNATLLMDLFGLAAPVVFSGHFPNFVPIIDGDFVPEHPRDAFEAGVGMDHDILVGSTQDDGAGFVYLNFLGFPQGNLLNWAMNTFTMDQLFSLLLNVLPNGAELVAAIYEKFPEMQSEDAEVRTRASSKVITDFIFGSKAHLEADLHSTFADMNNGGSTYLYEYNHRASFLKYEPWVTASHIDDLYAVFGEVLMRRMRDILALGDFDDTDKVVRDNVQRYYANFAHTGNPNEGPHKVITVWPEYNTQSREYMVIGAEPEVLKQDQERLDTYKWWNDDFFSLTQNPGSRSGQSPINSDIGQFLEEILRHAAELELDHSLATPTSEREVLSLLVTGLKKIINKM